MSKPIPLAYTFGNHMHWVDMQWLWGYEVLPGSIDDMLAYCRATGVKGNINFDGIGYEKLASESPEHLAKLREAIKEGTIEVVGGSYGQPYGLFHGGESNVRQRVYGVRTAMRVLDCRPKTFWEEEFDCYPQLPQMLAGCGFTGASLYFQWTWHTPEVPMEEAPVVLWEGIDGTQIPTATRNRMNLHQWPEDFQILLDDLAANPPSVEDGVPPLVLQWLELMPTQDWMCRSELMIPMLLELKNDPRFEILALTLGEYLEKWQGKDMPVRQYQMDDFWHGMTLGKNGDNHPKRSLELEDRILAAETSLAILGLFGRPYDPWDVYPTWEIEEAWRNLLAAQHHDNHECEGLCGHVARTQFETVENMMSFENTVDKLAKRVGVTEGEYFTFNRYGWNRKIEGYIVPAMGYTLEWSSPELSWSLDGSIAVYEDDFMRIVVDCGAFTIREISTKDSSITNVQMSLICGQELGIQPELILAELEGDHLGLTFGSAEFCRVWLKPEPSTGSIFMYLSVVARDEENRPAPGYSGAVRLGFDFGSYPELIVDSPYCVHHVCEGSKGKRKYPEGDWMTSPQWFESVEGAFTSQSFVDIRQENGAGLLISHSSSQQWFRTESGIENVVLSMDPWDSIRQRADSYIGYRLHPHDSISNAECVRRSTSMLPFAMAHGTDDGFIGSQPPLPRNFSSVIVHSANVLATAFYREQESFCKRGLDTYAGEGMGHPYILRLVEYDGISGDVEVTIPGPIAKAFKTNLMGEIEMEISVSPDNNSLLTTEPAKLEPFGIQAVRVTVPMRAHEIATLYLDIVPGRKQFRDLDAKREIWATVHRVED